MTIFQAASRGVGWLLSAQVVVAIGQFLYSAVTARVFTPSAFGAFAAALGLQGLLILLTTTGLPSVVLKEAVLTSTDVRWVRLYAVVGGVAAALAFVILSPSWLMLLRASEGLVYVPLLSVALAIGPLATIESSLLRREGRPVADSVTIVIAFLVPAVVALAAAIAFREVWALALATALGPLVLGLSAGIGRKHRVHERGTRRHRELLSFVRKVSFQNVAFLLIGQAPAWTVSATLGAASLGQFSRANTLAGIPSTSLSTAMNRAVQPHWRKLGIDPRKISEAMRDTAVLGSSISLPLFSILAVVGPDLSVVWLGEGWKEASQLVPWLAVAFGVQIPFTMLSSSLEMRSHFAPVRWAQLGLAGGLIAGLTTFVLTNDMHFAAGSALLSQLVGLIVLLAAMSKSSHTSFYSLLAAILVPGAWAVLVAATGLLGVVFARESGMVVFDSRELLATALGGLFASVAWIATLRWQPVIAVLVRRGIQLPRFLEGRHLN